MDSDDELFFHLMMQEEADAAEEDQRILTCLKALQVELCRQGMENEADNANDMVEQEESTSSALGQVFSGRNPKRLRSKAWDDFTPIYIDGKVARAECIHCHQVFNNNGTSKLLKHQAKCSPSAQKRPVKQKLPLLLTSQNKSLDTTDALPKKKARVLPDILTDMNMECQKVDQNLSHEELAAHDQKNLASFGTPTDKDGKNQSHVELTVPEQDIPKHGCRATLEHLKAHPEEDARIHVVR